MQLVCPKCGAAIAGADLDVLGRFGVCRPCGEIVPFGEPLAPVRAASASLARYKPGGLRWVEVSASPTFEAVMSPKRASAIPILGFVAVWDSFLLFWYKTALSAPHGAPVIMLLFPLLHVAAGLFITCQALRMLLNTTRVVLTPASLSVTSTPIPSKSVTLPTSEIDGFCVSEKSTSRQGSLASGLQSRHVVVANGGGAATPLPLPLANFMEAEYVVARLGVALEDVKRARQGQSYRG